MTIYHWISLAVWLISITAFATAYLITRARWARAGLLLAIMPPIGVLWWVTQRRQVALPMAAENDQRAEPPRRLPNPIATEDDYDSLDTLPGPDPDPDADDHELAQWLDTRAAGQAD